MSVTKSQRARLTKVVQMRERAKELFKQADELEEPLFDQIEVGTMITIDGKPFVLRDNFAEKNICFKTAAVKHYEFRPATKAELEVE